MRKLYYKTQRSYKRSSRSFERACGKSMTVPNETMTIKELLARARNGINPILQKVAYNDMGVDEVTKFNRPICDMTDLEELRQMNQSRQKDIEEKIQSMKDLQKLEENPTPEGAPKIKKDEDDN